MDLQQLRSKASKSRFGWTKLLVTMLALLLIQVASGTALAVTSGKDEPNITSSTLQPDLQNESHITFTYMWFNREGGNYGYCDKTNHVWLKVDGVNAVDLSEASAGIDHVCRLFNGWTTRWSGGEDEANTLCSKEAGKVLINETFHGANYLDGRVILSNPTKSGDFYYVTVEVILQEWNADVKHTISIVGDWVKNGAKASPTTHTLTVTTEKPKSPLPSSYGTITRSASRKATYSMNLTRYSRSVVNAENVTVTKNWRYSLGLWSSKPTDSNVANAFWGWNAVSPAEANSSRLLWIDDDSSEAATSMSGTFNVPSNYQTYKVYPRTRMWIKPYPDKTQNTYWEQAVVGYNKNFSEVVIPGYPRPKSLKFETDQWSKSIKLTWSPEIYDASHVDKNGKWCVFRATSSTASTQTLVATLDYSATEYTDAATALSYDTKYYYWVAFVPADWKVTSPNSYKTFEDLYVSGNATVTRSLSIVPTLTSLEGGIRVVWNSPVSFKDASTTKTYTLKLYHGKNTQTLDTDNPLTTWTINNPDMVSFSYDHTKDMGNSRDTHYYQFEVVAMGKTWKSEIVSGRISGESVVTSLTASRGDFAGSVKLSWDAKHYGSDPCYYNLSRRPLGSQNDSEWRKIYSTSGTANNYSYDDTNSQPGNFYEYRVESFVYDNTGTSSVAYSTGSVTTDGFSLATGVISGRVTYGTGTAVSDVKVTLTSEDSDARDQFRALKMDGAKSGIVCNFDAQHLDNFFGSGYTMQFWMKPEAKSAYTAGTNYYLYDLYYQSSAYLTRLGSDANASIIVASRATTNTTAMSRDTLRNVVPFNQYSHISAVYSDNSKLTFVVHTPTATVSKEFSHAYNIYNRSKGSIGVGNATSLGSSTPYKGYLDEYRFWSKPLSAAEIEGNYNRVLSGTEKNLLIYWPMDEGLDKPSFVYDYSKSNGVNNGFHGTVGSNTTSSSIIPEADQLSLYAMTDEFGNYVLRGIPFNGEGTNYVIRPTKGVHEFDAHQSTRYISANSLVYSDVNFTDVSSFNVSGRVLYANTTYPVEGVSLYVDGVVCARNGEMIQTDANGNFTISVPIGDHFISVAMQGHTFTNFDGKQYKGTGYYPTQIDATGTNMEKHTFNQDMTGLTFFDNTLVPVYGRVVGGETEDAKPLGFGASVNNIGVATITLNAGATMNLNADKDNDYSARNEKRYLDHPSGLTIGSEAYVGAGEDGKGIITIRTDAVTGEFAVMLPPLDYTVTKVAVDKNAAIQWNTATKLDCTNPMVETSDSMMVDTTMQYVKYVASLKKCYRSEAVLEVSQTNARAAGAFGNDSVTVTDGNGRMHPLALYSQSASFQLPKASQSAYLFGYPVFSQGKRYAFGLKMYEKYVNNDGAKPVEYTVPLAGLSVKIANRLSDGTAINIDMENPSNHGTVNEDESSDNAIVLDADGRAVYTWTAGFPNIQGDHTFTMDMTYEKEGTSVGWEGNGFKGIVLGSLTNGSNFVTAGPDQVSMILRDPAGSNSYSWIEEGQTTTTTKVRSGSCVANEEFTTKVKVGTKNVVITGTAVGGVVAKSVQQESKFDVTAGLNISGEQANDTTEILSFTTNKRIETSSAPDFVGAVGDVFIGYATNYSFGKAREVGISWNAQRNAAELHTEEVYNMGDNFGTSFSYTQNHIENVLIPNFYDMRNAIIEPVASYDNITADDNRVRYVSTLSTDDPRFGSSNNDRDVWGSDAKFNGLNGPSYHIILPKCAYETVGGHTRIREDFHMQDTILWYNQQISVWRQHLANNERSKVTAIEGRNQYLQANYSFDAGASVESSTTSVSSLEYVSTNTSSVMLITNIEKDFDFENCGLTVSNDFTVGGQSSTSTGTTTENTLQVGFALVEDGDDDALTVDVLRSPDGFGPIFYTRGGQTSAPYEDAVVTKYYRPGFVVSAKTMQIEQPKLSAEVTTLSGVPSGKAANFTVQIMNTSETNEDCWFNLSIVDSSNPDGADVLMDGYNITNGRTILVPAGNPLVKTIQVKQTNPNIYDYENLILRISSLSQPDDTGVFPAIADELPLTVHFQKASSDVDLAIDLNAINTQTGTSLKFMVSGYDKNATGLQKLELQYQRTGDPQWTSVKSYTVAQLDNSGAFEYVLDMSNSIAYPDGEYNFRALCTSQFGNETVTTASEISTLYKDVLRPRLISTIAPTDGILNAGDDILLTFNEDIRDGELRELDNFILKGELNEAAVAHDVAANFTGVPAKTASRIDLNKKSFAVDMWLQYAAAGRLFVHGNGSEMFEAKVDASNRLVVTISGQTYTSVAALQPNKWMFFSLAYDSESSSLSAHYAYDATEVTLFNNIAVNSYQGFGSLQLGEGLTGQMHEVALWDNARTWIDAQGEMYKSKSRYTQGLIGYWRMNEGHGTMAADVARNRTMTMPSATAWYFAKVNYSLVLENDLVVGAFIGDKTTASDESYLAELWFRADAANAAVATIMALSDDRLDIHLTASGAMEMVANGSTYTVSNANYRDGNWHHLALNVLKSTNGNATVYVDGNACKSVSASSLPALQSSHILFGGRKAAVGGGSAYVQPMKGNLDEIRIWKGYFDASVIRNNMYSRVDADDEALLAYYPFEYTHLDEGNQNVESATLSNRIPGASGQGATLQLMSGGQNANAGTDALGAIHTTSVGVVGLKAAPVRENVNFSFTASERQLRIQLTDYPARLENCTVNLTVKGIRDQHGNTCENISWDLLVRQNQLLWVNTSADVRKVGAEEVTFTAEMINEGSSSESWSLIGLPAWLKASAESGTLAPQQTRTITFTVDPSLSAGRYDETLFLTGSMNIAEPLAINVVSLVEAPDWSVDGNEYELNMNVIARLKVDGNYSEDPEDIVAAFNGERCVGVAKPTYVERFDSYYLMLTIYGDAADTNAPLQFKVFDASTGIIYPSSRLSTPISFVSDAFHGSLAAPVVVETTNEIEQNLALAKGWTWTSFYLNPTESSPAQIFGGESGECVSYIKTRTQFAQRSGASWVGPLTSMASGTMYRIRTSAATSVSVIGDAVNAASAAASQRVNAGWNWLGYTNSGSTSLNAAFADLNPMNDDVVKNQSSFAVYSDGEWIGSLSAMVPGTGYAYYSNHAQSKTFNYPVVNAVGSANVPARVAANAMAMSIAANYQGNMNMIVVVMDGDEVVSDAVIMAYDEENQLRGFSNGSVRNDRHFLTIGGEGSGDRIRFVVICHDTELSLSTTISYLDDKMMGSMSEPFVLQLKNVTGIENLSAEGDDDCYNMAGQKVERRDMRGIYLQNGKKVIR